VNTSIYRMQGDSYAFFHTRDSRLGGTARTICLHLHGHGPELLVTVVNLTILVPWLPVPYTIVLVLSGLLFGFVPGLPRFTLDPDLIFLLFLPPLLYSSAWTTS
jgi:hypothetical protein